MDVINRANDASVMMKLLLRELQLPAQTTHIRFVEAFSKLQADSKMYEMELRSAFEEGIRAGTIQPVKPIEVVEMANGHYIKETEGGS